jgi:hypothetical protein
MASQLPSGLRRTAILLTLGGLTVAGCGHTAGAATSPLSRSQWASRANAICRAALPDASHELINHLDEQHVRAHGMAVVRVGSGLDDLGPPAGTSAVAYRKMLEQYMESAVLHGEAANHLHTGDDGNAAFLYALALNKADRADVMAATLGGSSCERFGYSR